MDIIGFVVLVFIGLLLIGILFKLAKFVLKLFSLLLLFAVLIWLGVFIYDSSLLDQAQGLNDKLYVVEFEQEYRAYTLSGTNYTFVNLTNDGTLDVFESFDSVYLISYETIRDICVDNTTVFTCIQNASLELIWTELE